MKTKITFFLVALFCSVESFGQTFNYQGNIYTITSPNTVEVAPYSTSLGSIGFSNLVLPETVMYSGASYFVTRIGNNAFDGYGCHSVTIPSSVMWIGDYAFRNNPYLTTVTSPLVQLGDLAFDGCSSLTSASFAGGFGIGTFRNCTSLTSVTISDSVTSIDYGAFYGCTGLTSVTIPNSVTSIGDFAFFDCTGLTSVTISDSVTSIDYGVFYGCTSLTSFTILSSQKSIGSGVFLGYSGLTSVTIPNSVMSIGSQAFYNCTSLTSITIPNSVTSIGSQAFGNCIGLNSVTVNWATPLIISADVFQGLTLSNIILNVPTGTIPLYDATAVWTDFNLTTLGNEDFSNIKMKFYPNPATTSITFPQEISGLEIYNITGKKVKYFENTITTFNIESIEKGMYLLKGKTAEGKIINEKLIKN